MRRPGLIVCAERLLEQAWERHERRGRYTSIMVVRAYAVFALAAVGVVAIRTPSPAACASDTFTVDGNALVVGICTLERPAAVRGKAPAGNAGTLQETVSVKGHAPLTRTAPYSRLASDATARTIDDVPLQSLGIPKTLHVTLAVRAGNVRLEHALLVPGAVVLK